MEWLREQIYNNFITDNRWRYLTNGLKVTLEVTFFAVLIGILLGLLVAVVRSTYAKTGQPVSEAPLPVSLLLPWGVSAA